MNKSAPLLLLLLFPGSLCAQSPLSARLEKLPGVISVASRPHKFFSEYFELAVEQPVDHAQPQGKKFLQRVFLGYTDAAAPTVLETEGYACGASARSDYRNEPCELLKGNMIVAEHRYFGKSAPDSLDWDFLTVQQAAQDYHQLRQLFAEIFTGKWISTGSSKGGQAALAYRIYFPNDVDATVAYSTPVKQGLRDERFEKFFERDLQTEGGRMIRDFQERCFRRKKEMLPAFENFCREKKLEFGTMSAELVLEYCLLEYHFSFRQKGERYERIPNSSKPADALVKHLADVVPPRFFSTLNRPRIEPAFCMFYRELGYYEYDTAPFSQWLANNNYPNSIFAPANAELKYDSTYHVKLREGIARGHLKNTLFIYGSADPWSAAQPEFTGKSACKKFTVKNGGHYCEIGDLDEAQKKEAEKFLTDCLEKRSRQ